MVDLIEKVTKLYLGHQGENLVRTVKIDISRLLEPFGDDASDVSVVLMARRKGDDEPYAAVTTMNGSILLWPITSVETEHAGHGHVEVRVSRGETLCKSNLIMTYVEPSIMSEAVEIPKPSQGWVDQVVTASAEATSAATKAKASATAAAKSAMSLVIDDNVAAESVWSSERIVAYVEPLFANTNRKSRPQANIGKAGDSTAALAYDSNDVLQFEWTKKTGAIGCVLKIGDTYEAVSDYICSLVLTNLGSASVSFACAISNSANAWGSLDGSISRVDFTSVTIPAGETKSISVDLSSPSIQAFWERKAAMDTPSHGPVGLCLDNTAAADANTVNHISAELRIASKTQGRENRVVYAECAMTADNAIHADEADHAAESDTAQTAAAASVATMADYAMNAGVIYSPAADFVFRNQPPAGGDQNAYLMERVDSTAVRVYRNPEVASDVIGSRFLGVYIKVPFTTPEGLNKIFRIEIEKNGGGPSVSHNQRTIQYGVTDWGPTVTKLGSLPASGGNVLSIIRANEASGDADLLTQALNNGYIYLLAIAYVPSGQTTAYDYTFRLRQTPLTSHVIATEAAGALDERIAALETEKSGRYITCWGDSLTAGGGWTTKLGELAGLTVYNGGTGGENARCIVARQGADVMIVNNIDIPAGKTAVLIASRATDGGIPTAEGWKVMPLLQGGAHVNPCRIGDVEGTLAWTGSGYSDTTGTWTFTRNTAGEAVSIRRPTAIRTKFDISCNAPYLMVLFFGQNGGYRDIADLVRQHRRVIEHSRCAHYIILGLSSGSAESRAEYETAMKQEFGRYFLSLREYLSAPIYGTDGRTIVSCYGLDDQGMTPGSVDYGGTTYVALDEIAAGTVPHQILSDSVHYTAGTKEVIGKLIYRRCCELGIF